MDNYCHDSFLLMFCLTFRRLRRHMGGTELRSLIKRRKGKTLVPVGLLEMIHILIHGVQLSTGGPKNTRQASVRIPSHFLLFSHGPHNKGLQMLNVGEGEA